MRGVGTRHRCFIFPFPFPCLIPRPPPQSSHAPRSLYIHPPSLLTSLFYPTDLRAAVEPFISWEELVVGDVQDAFTPASLSALIPVHAGCVARIGGLVSRLDLNGQSVNVGKQNTNLRWAVYASDGSLLGAMKASNLTVSKCNFSVADPTVGGRTPVILACELNQLKAVEALLKHNADPNVGEFNDVPDLEGDLEGQMRPTPLELAAQKGSTEVMDLLLAYNADPNDGVPMIWSIENGHCEMFKALLKSGASPNQCRHRTGFSALMAAAVKGDTAILETLIKSGANPDQATTGIDRRTPLEKQVVSAIGVTPLYIAVARSKHAAVKMLISHGASVSTSGSYDPLMPTNTLVKNIHVAATRGHADIMEVLLDADADPNELAGSISPLMLAMQGNPENREGLHVIAYDDVVKLLVARGANINYNYCSAKQQDLCGTGTVIDTLYYANQQKTTEMAEFLLINGIDPDSLRNAGGHSTLHYAASTGNLELAKVFLKHGANPSLYTTKEGFTPMMIAAKNDQLDIMKLLSVYGASTSTFGSMLSQLPSLGNLYGGAMNGVYMLPTLVDPMSFSNISGNDKQGHFVQVTSQIHAPTNVRHLIDTFTGPCMVSVVAWTPLQTAAATRMHAEAAHALKQGRINPEADHQNWISNCINGYIIDGDEAGKGIPPSDLPAIASMLSARKRARREDPWSTSHTIVPSAYLQGAVPVTVPICPETIKFIRKATIGWCPSTHWLHHATFRTAVHAVLMVSERLRGGAIEGVAGVVGGDGAAGLAGPAQECARAVLPSEIWLYILHFCLRNDWNVAMMPGTVVEINGLKSRPDLNGTIGVLQSRKGERWVVQPEVIFERHICTGIASMALKESNLTSVPASMFR